MIKASKNVNEAKKEITLLSGKAAKVIVNLGRNKKITYDGTLAGIYPALFTVVPFDKDFKGKTSYSYSEYLCKNVVLSAKEG